MCVPCVQAARRKLQITGVASREMQKRGKGTPAASVCFLCFLRFLFPIDENLISRIVEKSGKLDEPASLNSRNERFLLIENDGFCMEILGRV